jgi:ABC-type nickel/cobalt efflux system permease component RcnA
LPGEEVFFAIQRQIPQIVRNLFMISAIIAGAIAGAVHVWSGPDHLTAIAPLAVRRPRRSWIPGARWGLGHSAGVGVIGLLSLWLRDWLPVDLLSTWGERLVGIMLFGIGLWALRRALKHNVHAHEHEHDGEKHLHLHTHSHGHAKHHDRDDAHRHTHAAFGIGILHGLAGSSHFLGVLPILAFPTKLQAVSYLAAFGVGTVISMATFSSVLGLITQQFAVGSAKVYRGLLGTCAITAMAVGCFWLVTSWR